MKKCLKFQEFIKKYKGVDISSDDILKELVDEYESKNDEEKSDENDYIDALNMSANESEDVEHKKNENKYMHPLPGIGNNFKKKGGNKNSETDKGNKSQENNNSDIQINIDENEENKNNNSEENNNNLNEIKEKTSFIKRRK